MSKINGMFRAIRRIIFTSITFIALGVVGVAVADFTNGGFETGDFTGWTLATYLNGTPTLSNPVEDTPRSSLNLAGGGTNGTFVRTNATTESQFDTNLGSSSTLRFPRYGNDTAVVNYYLTSSTNANGIKQAMTVTTADIDPLDNKPHVRFAIAPVLQDGSHAANQQPYFFVNIRNVTQNTTLFNTFKYANQPGVPWKSGTGVYKYTDWQLIDVAPGGTALEVGDSVEVEVIASRCTQSGHAGYVYVDGIGSFLPGISVVAVGPNAANSGDDMTYTYTYRNGATTAVSNATVTVVLPANTTFQSVDAGGVTCTTPSIGAAGTVTCNFGNLSANAAGTFKLTVNINSGASGKISHGNYSIDSDETSALLGPLVQTNITSGADYADLEATITDGIPAVDWGTPVQYTLTVRNNGPEGVNNATVSYPIPSELTGVTWTCVASGSASCTASGSGAISDSVDIPNGDSVVYTINATVIAGTGTDSVASVATVTPPGGVTDNFTANNEAVDTNQIGALYQLTVNKTPTAGGTIASSPAGLSCNTSCSSASADFVDGSSVTLSAIAATRFQFLGWSGGACSGVSACTLTMTANTTVSASFDCQDGFFGATCASTCPGSGNCSGHGTCDDGMAGSGVCTCDSGYAGATCTVDTDGDNDPDATDTDDDNDGIADGSDCAPLDGTKWRNQAYPDSDTDGVRNSTSLASVACFGTTPPSGSTLATNGPDNCPSVSNSNQADLDNDGQGNLCDSDADGDGIPNTTETTADKDNDGRQNWLDKDADNDGIPDSVEGTADIDGDGVPNYLDKDSDGDGVPDTIEGAAQNGFISPSGIDANNDGIDDAFVDGSGNSKLSLPDQDQDGIPDYLDVDSDGDGISDRDEAFDRNHDGIPDVTPSGVDADGDGIDDAFQSATAPSDFTGFWRDSTNGANQCSPVNLKPATRKALTTAQRLKDRAYSFSKRAEKCGSRSLAGIRAAAKRNYAGMVRRMNRDIGATTMSCQPNVCTTTSTSTARRWMKNMAQKMYQDARRAKLLSIKFCGHSPAKSGEEDTRKDTAAHLRDANKAIDALPRTLTSCS